MACGCPAGLGGYDHLSRFPFLSLQTGGRVLPVIEVTFGPYLPTPVFHHIQL